MNLSVGVDCLNHIKHRSVGHSGEACSDVYVQSRHVHVARGVRYDSMSWEKKGRQSFRSFLVRLSSRSARGPVRVAVLRDDK